jgi:hypothetical protein
MPHNTNRIAYQARLYPWAIARLLPNMQRTIVGRFRSRSDADGHLQCLRQLIPHASFVVVFDCQPDLEAVTASPASTEEVVVCCLRVVRGKHPD